MARRSLGVLTLALAAVPAAAQLRAVEVPIGGRAGVDSLAALGFAVADVRVVGGALRAVIVADGPAEAVLRREGYAFVAAPAPVAADTFRVYRSFDKPATGVRATLEAWAAADTLIHLDSIGASIEGRPILAMKIGAGADSPARPNVLFMATHHAREWVSTEMAMKLIRWIADSLPRPLLITRDIWVIPVENPDGYQYSFTTERLWRKNRRANANGSFGVDPNRNYPAFWGRDEVGSSSNPVTEVYRGTGPASEPETQAIVAFHAAHRPVVAVSYHTYSGLLLHPYGFAAGQVPPDLPLFRALAGTDLAPAVRDSVPGSTLTYYHPGPGWNLYPTNGEYTEWAYRAHGALAFTPELTSGCCAPGPADYYGFIFPDDSALVERVFRDNLPFAVAVIEDAADPRTAVGASGLAVTPPRFDAVWPESRLSLDAGDPAPPPFSVRLARGALVTRFPTSDSLQRGPYRSDWRADLRADTVRAIRADPSGIAAELLTLAGAEAVDAGWTGWTRSAEALVGQWSWLASGDDTLTSPVADLAGRERVWLQFWHRHAGSTFSPQLRGVVQFSADSGATWTDVWAVVGAGGSWYPERVDLPQAAGARGARVRFIARGFTWWVDAVGLATDSTGAFGSASPGGGPRAVGEPAARRAGGHRLASVPAGRARPHLRLHRAPAAGDHGDGARQRVRVGRHRRGTARGQRRVPRGGGGRGPALPQPAVRGPVAGTWARWGSGWTWSRWTASRRCWRHGAATRWIISLRPTSGRTASGWPGPPSTSRRGSRRKRRSTRRCRERPRHGESGGATPRSGAGRTGGRTSN